MGTSTRRCGGGRAPEPSPAFPASRSSCATVSCAASKACSTGVLLACLRPKPGCVSPFASHRRPPSLYICPSAATVTSGAAAVLPCPAATPVHGAPAAAPARGEPTAVARTAAPPLIGPAAAPPRAATATRDAAATVAAPARGADAAPRADTPPLCRAACAACHARCSAVPIAATSAALAATYGAYRRAASSSARSASSWSCRMSQSVAAARSADVCSRRIASTAAGDRAPAGRAENATHCTLRAAAAAPASSGHERDVRRPTACIASSFACSTVSSLM